VLGEHLVRLFVRVARVDDDGQVDGAGDRELLPEGQILVLTRRQVAEEVEPDLADRDDLRRRALASCG